MADISPSHDRPIQSETLTNLEKPLSDLAKWWGDRLICRGSELVDQPFYTKLFPKGTPRSYYALVTHHVKNEQQKQLVHEIGGVIGHPDIYSLFYGKSASDEILRTLGVDGSSPSQGTPHDGLTHIFLHPLPMDLSKDCRILLEGDKPSMFRSSFERSPFEASRQNIEQVLQAPWETLPVELTNDPARLRKALVSQSGLMRDYIDFEKDDFVYRLRMLENQYLLGIV